eukprot:scaffold35756_cov58-Phaeocystis_antarctica.AAC.5
MNEFAIVDLTEGRGALAKDGSGAVGGWYPTARRWVKKYRVCLRCWQDAGVVVHRYIRLYPGML